MHLCEIYVLDVLGRIIILDLATIPLHSLYAEQVSLLDSAHLVNACRPLKSRLHAFSPTKGPPMISKNTPLVYNLTYWWNVRMPSVVQHGSCLVFSRLLGVDSHDWNWRTWRHFHQY